MISKDVNLFFFFFPLQEYIFLMEENAQLAMNLQHLHKLF